MKRIVFILLAVVLEGLAPKAAEVLISSSPLCHSPTPADSTRDFDGLTTSTGPAGQRDPFETFRLYCEVSWRLNLLHTAARVYHPRINGDIPFPDNVQERSRDFLERISMAGRSGGRIHLMSRWDNAIHSGYVS